MSDDSNSKNAATQTNPISPGQVQALLFTLQQLSENLAPLRELAEFNSKQAVRQGNATGHTTTAQAPTIGTAAEDEQHTTLGDFLVTCAPTEQRLRRVLDCFCDLISGSGCDYRQYCVGRYADSSQGYLILRLREGYKTMPICAEPNHFGPEPGDSLMIQDISARVIELWPKAFCTVMETPAQKLIWDLSMLHKHGASYSIGADGYPKHTRIERDEYPAQGRAWHLNIIGRTFPPEPVFVVGFDDIAWLLHFFLTGHKINHYGREFAILYFLISFAQTYHRLSHRSTSYKHFNDHGCIRNETEFVLQFHMRHLQSGWDSLHRKVFLPSEGLVVERLKVKVGGLGQGNEHNGDNNAILLRERGLSLSLLLMKTSGFPYTIIAVTESIPGFEPDRNSWLPHKDVWESNGIQGCGQHKKVVGFIQFIAAFMLQVEHWDKGWKYALDSIDEAVRVQIDESLDQDRCESVMFDDSFKLSKMYFTVLQVLNLSASWIEGATSEWNNLNEQWRHEFSTVSSFNEEDLKRVQGDWDKAATIFEARAKRHLDRIRQKTEDVKGLRDGLFNATSLREATKGMALNKAIYVFTIVTVIYTPISFMATFWAIPTLNTPSSEDSSDQTEAQPPRGFLTTFIVVPLATYVGSIAFVFFLNSTETRRRIIAKVMQVPGSAVGVLWPIWSYISMVFTILPARVAGLIRDTLRSLSTSRGGNAVDEDVTMQTLGA